MKPKTSNDRYLNVYLAVLLMRQKQDTILVMLEYYAHSRTRARKKEGTRHAYTRSHRIR